VTASTPDSFAGPQGKGKVVVVTGPSGVGKSTLLAAARDRLDLDFSVSATTREPRSGETEGVHYFFLDRPEFQRRIEAGRMLEWAEVYGNLYGTPAEPVEQSVKAGRTVIMDIDLQGARQVHEKLPGATLVMILPPDEQELQRRLRSRGTESPEQLERRISKATEEIRQGRASGIFDHFVVNDNLDRAVDELVNIITQE
jgi:guanylate kinase